MLTSKPVIVSVYMAMANISGGFLNAAFKDSHTVILFSSSIGRTLSFVPKAVIKIIVTDNRATARQDRVRRG